MLELKLGLFADTSVGIVLAWAPRTEHSWAARLMQPHSKLGLVVSMIRGLTLGLSVDALVGIVLGTGTPDKAQLEEVAVGAALGLQTEHSWATRSVQYGAPQSLGTKFTPDDTSGVRCSD